MHINDLPEEVLLLVIENCTAKDLHALAHTCSHFAKIMKLDIIWKKLYKKKYNMESQIPFSGSGFQKCFPVVL